MQAAARKANTPFPKQRFFNNESLNSPQSRPASRAGGFCYRDYKEWNDGSRWEVINGESYMMSAPSVFHQSILMEISRQFADFLRDKPCKVFPAPLDVRLAAPLEDANDSESDRDIVQPDIIVVCDKRKLRPEACHGAPDLVVEILSPSNRPHDLLRKFNLYLKYGVREYWVIDAENRIAQVHTLAETAEGRRYQTQVFGADDFIPAGIFNNELKINLADVFNSLA